MSASRLPVAILAGGLATRLRPLTETIPKALIEVNGEPFIAHQLRLLRDNDIQDVVICAGFLGEMIEAYVGRGERFGLHTRVVFDGPTLLGTAGALRQAAQSLGEAFFVLYGDSYLTCDYLAVQRAFENQAKPALMTVYRNDGRWDQSNVEFRDSRIVSYSKHARSAAMRHIDYGLGILRRTALDLVPRDEAHDLAALYADLLARDQLAGYEVEQRFYEIGSPDGLEATRQAIIARQRGAVL